jgi:hypothetical protein
MMTAQRSMGDSSGAERTVRKVDTYERFYRHLAAWVDREIDFLLVYGPQGTGKSCGYRTALGNRPFHVFGGRQSPLHVYLTLHDDPHRPVVLDDISSLLRDDTFRDMLKGLCDTGPRVVCWGTTTPKLQGRPTSFTATCPVLIVLNKIPARDPDLEAILDRCDAIRFEPTKAEIVARMYELWPDDGELIALLSELPAMPSLRTLEKARRWQRSAHLNMIEELLAECGVPKPVALLAQIMESLPEAEWCAKYVERTTLTDRSYRRHKHIALQLLACRNPQNRCPNVRSADPPSVSAGGGAVGELPRPSGHVSPDGHEPLAIA